MIFPVAHARPYINNYVMMMVKDTLGDIAAPVLESVFCGSPLWTKLPWITNSQHWLLTWRFVCWDMSATECDSIVWCEWVLLTSMPSHIGIKHCKQYWYGLRREEKVFRCCRCVMSFVHTVVSVNGVIGREANSAPQISGELVVN